jgi:hypothetical protein
MIHWVIFIATDFGEHEANAGCFFNLPHPIQARRDLRNPGLPSRNLLLPLSVRFFAGGPARWPLLNGLQLRLL